MIVIAGSLFHAAGILHAGQEWGSLRGRFIYDGAPPPSAEIHVDKDVDAATGRPVLDESVVVDAATGGLANVVVYLRTRNAPVHPNLAMPADATATMRIERLSYIPHVLTMRLDQDLVIVNGDSVAHNPALLAPGEPDPSPLIVPPPFRRRFTRAQSVPVPIQCSIHPWMKAYVLPRVNPYTAVSAADGTFQIEKLPAGDWEFQLWHERAGYLAARTEWKRGRALLTIPANDALDLGEIRIAPELLDSP